LVEEQNFWTRAVQTAARMIRAPFLMLGILLALIPAIFIFAVVSVGDWCEDLLKLVGYRARPHWLPGALGILGYVGFGIAVPVYLGDLLLGWPGRVAAPILALACIAVLGQW
jgi:hypothetical protein